jgi:hypothetical protein
MITKNRVNYLKQNKINTYRSKMPKELNIFPNKYNEKNKYNKNIAKWTNKKHTRFFKTKK